MRPFQLKKKHYGRVLDSAQTVDSVPPFQSWIKLHPTSNSCRLCKAASLPIALASDNPITQLFVKVFDNPLHHLGPQRVTPDIVPTGDYVAVKQPRNTRVAVLSGKTSYNKNS